MHILIDIGNSTVVIALADSKGDITATWRFKTKKEETASFFRYELRQGLRKYGVETADIQNITISSVVPEVNDDIAQAVVDLTGITPHSTLKGLLRLTSSRHRSWVRIVWPMLSAQPSAMVYQPSSSTSVQLPRWELSMKTRISWVE